MGTQVRIGTPNDPTDDYKLVAYIQDANANEVFDLDKVDHTLSGGDNDPETDWIYIYDVIDHTPGTIGYNAVVASGFNSGMGSEIMARVVLVNWNGGSVSAANWPNNLNATLPENGTVFRIETYKPSTDISNEFVIPLNYELFQNYPNPFNPTTKMRFGLPERTIAKLTVYDILGRAISTLVDGEFEAGYHEVNFDASKFSSGIYFYRLQAGNFIDMKKMILAK
ncbi:MAG: T9SS type A sorting domain-containing protein [Melioribacteraceae bacterium]